MTLGPFHRNPWPTLGVEIELQLVDAGSMGLKSSFAEIELDLPEALRGSVKPEFMQCYVEINSGVCRTVDDLAADLAPKIRAVEQVAARHGTRLFWAATHPFSRWQDQQITPNERYYRLADQLRETVIRPVTFGLHVHVGVETGDQAILVGDQLLRYLPLLLALSANSPFWQGRRTGHHAHRIEVLEGFPTGGLPPRMRSWDEYLGLVHQMKAAGFIASHNELWWDVRPHAGNGTIEVRICDMPADLSDLLGLTALIQCLVRHLALEMVRGVAGPDCHPLLIRQNRWRAARYGLGADLVEPETLETVPARGALGRLVARLRGLGAELGCDHHLETAAAMAGRPCGSERQLAIFEQTGDLAEVVRRMTADSALTDVASPRETVRTVISFPDAFGAANYRPAVLSGFSTG